MPDYAKTVMYKLVCKDINIKQTYGGHTTNIVKRRQLHKSRCNNTNNIDINCKSYLYNFMRENGGWINWSMIWDYDFCCISKREAVKEERKFIEKNKCELNSICAYRTEEEGVEYQQIYYQDNKENLTEKKKQKIKCECGCIIARTCISRHRKTKKHINLLQALQAQ